MRRGGRPDGCVEVHPGQPGEDGYRRVTSHGAGDVVASLARPNARMVGRTELGYNFRQLALVERLSSPDAARMALRRALLRLSEAIEGAGRRRGRFVPVGGASPILPFECSDPAS